MVHRPLWWKDGHVFVTYAPTLGINKDGHELFVVDSSTGRRTETIDDRIGGDIDQLISGDGPTTTSRFVPDREFSLAVPTYYDHRSAGELDALLAHPEFEGFTSRSLGDLITSGQLLAKPGHGSPSADMRTGRIPYIKVSDIRAGQVNFNPSNMVSTVVARRLWRGTSSGVNAWDLITPIRASKNIGEFAMIMSGQEQMVLTKEVLILRVTLKALPLVDPFYLLWAMSLTAVRDQWRRILFMQTNREDVGDRWLEIRIPWPTDERRGSEVSAAFRAYYLGMDQLRREFVAALDRDGLHHVFLGAVTGDDVEGDDDLSDSEEESDSPASGP